jgi:methyl-accepting chemotaxis protein
MDEMKKTKSETQNSNTRSVFWQTLVMEGVLLLIYLYAFLFSESSSTPLLITKAGFFLAIILGLAGIAATTQNRQELGIRLILYPLLLVGLVVASMIQERVLPVSFVLLVVFGLGFGWVIPKSQRQEYSIAFATVLVMVWVIEWLNPAWRQPSQLVQAGPIGAVIMAIVFAVILLRAFWGRMLKFLRVSIRNRLISIVIGAALLPVLLVSIFLGGITYVRVQDELIQTTFDRLDAIEEIKVNQLSSYMSERASDMDALNDAMGSMLSESLKKMQAINALKYDQMNRLFQTWDADVRDVASDPGVVLGIQDLTNNFQTLGSAQTRALYLGKSNLESAGDGSGYSLAHFEQHGFFSGYTAIHGYEDAFLIDLSGNVVYSAQKTDVFATNLITGPYKDSNLAKLFRNLISTQAGRSQLVDVALFEGQYAMFIGSPIYDGPTPAGMLIYQLPLDVIKNIAAERTGQGVTGDTFIIAMEDDGRITYRSDRTSAGNERFVLGYDITDIASQSQRNALDGKSGSGLVVGSTGEARINAYGPLEIEGLKWAVFTSVSAAEALSPTHLTNEKDFLTNYKEIYGYYDIFLIHPNGYIFYTVAKEADYQTNILTDEFSDSNLAALVNEVLDSKSYGFADFAYYEPSGGAPAAFFGIPVLNSEGVIQLIVAAQVSVDDINNIMNEAHGLGETGETYIIGQDFLGRMDSRFIEQFGVETTVLNPDYAVNTEAVRSAINGESGQGTIIDYRGLPVMSVWKPFTISKTESSQSNNLVWAVMTEIDEAEALTPVNQLAGSLGLIIGLAVLVVGALAVIIGVRFASGFVNPILSLTESATQVSAGNLSQRTDIKSEDEIGTLSNTFNTMTAQLQDTLEGLEQRVAARTKDLATVAEISTSTSTIREPFRMLETAVHLTQRGFNLYHAHVFTYHKDEGKLQIVACGYKEGDEHDRDARYNKHSSRTRTVSRCARRAYPKAGYRQ